MDSDLRTPVFSVLWEKQWEVAERNNNKNNKKTTFSADEYLNMNTLSQKK